ncbi:AfsR/SARP family transcriptional regulator [Saccharothrix obliqua]|uniref:AfsR/SARP family transcriptional regulator n=1 Tax=Saccharothrix obliqua TaxID=2861747 RepID=UPI001C5D3CD6|nr:AfsR/SARP family transcriptional regulator [Saccharothrix obliqua]MBW4717864.1 AfsR/SARP family transcriptional regulator [Saccharothrix obliqua]
MQFNVLGDLEVVQGGRHGISARQQGIVLAALLSRPGRVVSMEELITEVWGSRPTRRATASIYVHISQLRKFLSKPTGNGPAILTKEPGYLLTEEGTSLDYEEFRRLTERGRELHRLGEHEQAAERLRNALGLWRGPAFRDLRDGPVVSALANWLDELRLECAQMLVTSRFRLGRYQESIPLLFDLVIERPLDETFYQQLMFALFHSHRRAEALEVYQVARNALNEELGLDPCGELRDLHRAIIIAERAPSQRARLHTLPPTAAKTGFRRPVDDVRERGIPTATIGRMYKGAP